MLLEVRRVAASLAVAALCLASPAAAAPAADLTPAQIHDIAVSAYIYVYPLISMDVTRRVLTNVVPNSPNPLAGPANAFTSVRSYPTATMREVVRPNFDTLYSSAWLDLSHGPMILSVPDTQGRYYLMPMLDMWTDVFASPGKRTTGTKAGSYAVVPPGWSGSLPQGVVKIQAPSPYVWIIGRTQTNGPSDYAAVHKVQDGYKITPLAQWGKAAVAPAARFDPTVDMKTPPKTQVDQMKEAQYFTYAMRLIAENGAHLTDEPILAQMARIGLVPGKAFAFDKLDPAVASAMANVVADGQKRMLALTPTVGRIADGWSMNTNTMGAYGVYYVKRAIIAQSGLGANLVEDAIYPFLIVDSAGKPLTGDHAYVLHFAKSDLPPAQAFWSLTMYDADGFQVANALNRFALGDRDKLKYNADGSLDIYIQHADPGGDKTANWLPSPASGTLGITMRLYWPAASVLDGVWNPPAVTPAS